MRGIWTAVITPLTPTTELDLPAFKKILRDQADARVNGVVICGTTGESPSLTHEEKQILIRTAIEELKNSGVKVAAGTGSYNTAESVEFSRWAAEAGVDAVLVVCPYYNKPTAAGQEAHFLAVADAIPASSKCEVILYNIPGRTGVNMSPETIARLAEHPRIRTLKEATGNPAYTSEVLDAISVRNGRLDVMSGDDGIFLPILAVGGTGVISVASNLIPRAMVALQNAFDRGDIKEAKALHARYYPLFRDLFVESNPAPIKAAMAAGARCTDKVRLPLAPLLPASLAKVQAAMQRCGIEPGRPL